MSFQQGGPAKPVSVSTTPPEGVAAVPVVGYSSPTGAPLVEGGPAMPVYVVSDDEVAAGFPVQGGPAIPMVLVDDGRPVEGRLHPVPVYVVSGSLTPTPPGVPGQVAGWTLDDTSSGYVDFIGGLVFAPGGTAPGVAPGVIGDAADFAGGWLAVPDAPALSLAADFAVELWARPDSLDSFDVVAGKDNGGAAREWVIYQVSTGINAYIFNAAGDAFEMASGTLVFPVGSWTHIALTFTGSVGRLYLNGVLKATSPSLTGSIPSTSQAMSLGAYIGGSNAFDGRVDEVRVYQSFPDPGASYWLDRYNGGAGRRP